jgi:hypothetical protein
MTLIKFNIVQKASGKIGGTVFSNNGSGQYLKNLSLNSRTYTTSQIVARSTFSKVASMWKLLTTSERTDWNVAAALLVKYNRVKNLITRTGFNYFCEVQSNVMLVGVFTIQRIPPITPALLYYFTINESYIDRNDNSMFARSYLSDEIVGSDNVVMSVYASAPHSLSVKHQCHNLKFLASNNGEEGQTYIDTNFGTEYVAKFGRVPTVNETCTVKVKGLMYNYYVQYTNGQSFLEDWIP